MRNIQQFFKENPDKKAAFEKLGEAFNKKYEGKEAELLAVLAQRPLVSDDFPSLWKEFKEAFELLRKDGQIRCKCFICEKDLNDIYAADVEHYRPKSIYWWLAYDYANYYLACAECNRSSKRTQFPLAKDFKPTIYENKDRLHEENPLLLNPMTDNPLEYFRLVFRSGKAGRGKFIAALAPKPGLTAEKAERAAETIKVFNLDRSRDSNDTEKSQQARGQELYNELQEPRAIIQKWKEDWGKEKIKPDLRTFIKSEEGKKSFSLDLAYFFLIKDGFQNLAL